MKRVKQQIFYFYFFIQENLYFVRKYLTKLSTFALTFFQVACYWKCSNTNGHIDISFVDAILQSKILGNRIGIKRRF